MGLFDEVKKFVKKFVKNPIKAGVVAYLIWDILKKHSESVEPNPIDESLKKLKERYNK